MKKLILTLACMFSISASAEWEAANSVITLIEKCAKDEVIECMKKEPENLEQALSLKMNVDGFLRLAIGQLSTGCIKYDRYVNQACVKEVLDQVREEMAKSKK